MPCELIGSVNDENYTSTITEESLSGSVDDIVLTGLVSEDSVSSSIGDDDLLVCVEGELLNDDYFLYKPGIVGGQIAYGGKASGDNLLLYSNTFKNGRIYLGDNAFFYGNSGSFSTNGNIYLPTTTSSSGIIYQNGLPLIQSIGTNNIFVGTNSGNLTGTGSTNAALGNYSLYNRTTAGNTVALGYASMFNTTTGGNSLAIGAYTLYKNISGTNNSAVGYASLYNNLSGNFNSAIGDQALYLLTSGSNNVAIGGNTLHDAITGNNNTAVGYASGYYNLGSGNVFLGYFAGGTPGAGTYSNKLYIHNSMSDTPLIYGDFSTKLVQINDNLKANSLALGTATPDPTNYYLTIKSAATAAMKFDCGVGGFALLYLARDNVNIGYYGLSSSSNDIGFATYTGSNAGLSFVTSSVGRGYIDKDGSFWYGWNQNDDFFSIGLNPTTDTIGARLHIKDNRDGSTDRTAMIIDTISAWTTKSKLTCWKVGGIEKACVGMEGTFYQYKSNNVVTTDNTKTELCRITLTSNKRYQIEVRIVAKQSGNTNAATWKLMQSAKRLTTGGAVLFGSTSVVHEAKEDATWAYELTVDGNDFIVNITGNTGQTISWQGWLNYEVNT